MRFKKLKVKNFRNFHDVEIDITNKNVVFGMNDMGKTNLLTAIRFLFDREARNHGFAESDYYNNNTGKEILIQMEIDLSDLTSDDTNLIIAQVGGARDSRSSNSFFIQLTSQFDGTEYYGIPLLKWGSDLENLSSIPQKGNFSELDKIFKVVYIDPSIDLMGIFNKNRRYLFNEAGLSEDDQLRKSNIKEISKNLNEEIASMEFIKDFQRELTAEYKRFRKEDITVEMKSELEIKGYYNDLIPYIKREEEEMYYPTSGDGRKKLLSYSLVNFITRKKEKNKIVLYLIEEPENKLHRTMQIALSKQLFDDSIYNYFFLSTHSEEMLYEMDDTTLIRVHSSDESTCKSHVFKVPSEYEEHKKILNKNLATGLFADKVLLVEGPSEELLFEKVLSEMQPEYEVDGNYILNVNGVKFKEYYDVLKELNIKVFVKTDNDLQASSHCKHTFYLTGMNRGRQLISKDNLDNITIDFEGEIRAEKIKERKKKVFQDNYEEISDLVDNGIFLSEIDLEHDLSAVLGDRLDELLGGKDGIAYLQKSKQINMNELVIQLTEDECENIYNHSLFKVLQELR